jgi:transmembrane sensor
MTIDDREMDPIEIRAAQWILERDRADFSAERRGALEEWLSADARHREAYLRFDEAWRISAGLRAWRPADGQISPHILPTRSGQPVTRRSSTGQVFSSRSPYSRALLSLAASVLVMLLGVVTWEFWPPGTSYSTSIGGYERVVLDDGSILQLNTNTRLRVVLTERERRIRLDRGEAYFDVAHDRDRPFVVQAGNRQIVAVGTQFSVRREHDDLRVSVTEGTVRLADTAGTEGSPNSGVADLHFPLAATQPSDPNFLPAGTIARVPNTGPVRVEHRPLPELESQLTWRTGTLHFHNQPLSDVVAEINRYSRRQFVIADPALASLPFGGNIRATDQRSLIDALRTLNIHVEETHDALRISRNSP